MFEVLIVDDDDSINSSLCRMLPWADYGCRIVGTATNGEDALTTARYFKPDILFTDISMPIMDGLSLITAIRKILPRIEIAILTESFTYQHARTALNMGVTYYIEKPLSFNELDDALCKMTKKLTDLKSCVNEVFDVPKKSAEQALAEDSGNFILNNALQYIENHYTEKLTLAMVADQIYVSQWHLSKIIAKHTEGSFSDLVNQTRINHAKVLLADPTYKIQEISERVGFSSSNNFSRIFKQFEDCSANEYRNQLFNNGIYKSKKKDSSEFE